ncbi:MAG: CopD family protein [Acidimicrobiales bacterium]
MLPFTLDTLRLSLHVLAATVWVGGQLTLAGLVPGLRRLGDDVPRTVARRFNRIAWPAYAVLVATGIWNLLELPVGDFGTRWQVTLMVKITVVALAGASAAVHAGAQSKAVLAVFGALGGLTSIAAVVLGIMLHG